MISLSDQIIEYSEHMTSAEPEWLYQLRRETHLKTLYPRMLSGPYQGRLLSLISHMKGPGHILEIGTFTGYSCICMAEGLAPNGKISTIELDPELAHIIEPALERAGIRDKVDVYFGKALEILPKIKGTFDMVFIDADKQNYVTYYDQILPRVEANGIILADNVLWYGKVMSEEYQDKETVGLRNFNDFVSQDERVEKVLLPVRDGLMVIRKKG